MRKVEVDNPRYPHHIRIIRKVASDWLNEETAADATGTGAEMVVYEGCGRSYTDTTTTGDAKVDTNKRKASIPMRFDDWACKCKKAEAQTKQAGPPFPMSGDLLYVTKGRIGEEWEVKDFEPDNDRSVVYGELNRNFNIE